MGERDTWKMFGLFLRQFTRGHSLLEYDSEFLGCGERQLHDFTVDVVQRRGLLHRGSDVAARRSA
ncbi:hypothetical protein AB0B50_25810 [Streptomyces sp. NPDC041068]|uniref:hypothetical protein n=1 Tax=Streptomyces sp. NPDC041068 TaxID=3155130 RepID=UPI0033FB6782